LTLVFSRFGSIISSKVLTHPGSTTSRQQVPEGCTQALIVKFAKDSSVQGAGGTPRRGPYDRDEKTGARPNANVYVADLPPDIDQDSLEALFRPYGEISSSTILKTANKGMGKGGVGFVMFVSPESANAAVAGMHGSTPAGAPTPLIVRLAKDKHAAQTPPMFGQPQMGGFPTMDPYADAFQLQQQQQGPPQQKLYYQWDDSKQTYIQVDRPTGGLCYYWDPFKQQYIQVESPAPPRPQMPVQQPTLYYQWDDAKRNYTQVERPVPGQVCYYWDAARQTYIQVEGPVQPPVRRPDERAPVGNPMLPGFQQQHARPPYGRR